MKISINKLFFPLWCLVTLSLTPLYAQYEKLDIYFEQMIKDWDVPGASVGIIKDGELVFSGNYGTKKIGNSQKPDANTLYAIASNSKAFTASLLGILVQEGKLSWNDKVKDYLPYFSLFGDPWVSAEVTITDLLCHRVGLGTFHGDVIWYKSEAKAEDFIKGAGHLPKIYNFRDGFGYSNLMYITAGEIIEKLTGKSWAENIRERFFSPLGMTRSYGHTGELTKDQNIATPHARDESGNYAIEIANWENVAATGGILSSVNDMAKWMTFNMNYGIHHTDTILEAATINKLWKMHNVFSVDQTKPNDLGRRFSGYGLGWSIGEYDGKFMIGHTGGYDGMITAVTMLPHEKIGVVVLTNGLKSPIRAATNYAFDYLLEKPEKDWSKELLQNWEKQHKSDKRVEDIKNNIAINTTPSVPLGNCEGTYHSKIYGDITIRLNSQNHLELHFSKSPDLSAKLSHWQYDTWQILWDKKHAWFDFGTIKFVTDNNQNVKGIEFDVPNDDIFFHELKAVKK
jgi:CubicO group peptidase (beta-lactamase class C family)